jgi:hypothetical protein
MGRKAGIVGICDLGLGLGHVDLLCERHLPIVGHSPGQPLRASSPRESRADPIPDEQMIMKMFGSITFGHLK